MQLRSGMAVAVAYWLATTAPIRPLAWEPPHVARAALKRQKRKKKRKRKSQPSSMGTTTGHCALGRGRRVDHPVAQGPSAGFTSASCCPHCSVLNGEPDSQLAESLCAIGVLRLSPVRQEPQHKNSSHSPVKATLLVTLLMGTWPLP